MTVTLKSTLCCLTPCSLVDAYHFLRATLLGLHFGVKTEIKRSSQTPANFYWSTWAPSQPETATGQNFTKQISLKHVEWYGDRTHT
jgi:hypothetical protein